MTLEELSNFELLQLFKSVIAQNFEGEDDDYVIEIQEEIISRMEVEGA